MNQPHNDWELRNDLIQRNCLPVQKCFLRVLLPASSLHLNFKDHVCRHDNIVTGGNVFRWLLLRPSVAVYRVNPKSILRKKLKMLWRQRFIKKHTFLLPIVTGKEVSVIITS